MSEPHAIGARIVLIDPALASIELSAAEIGLPLNWRYGPSSRDLGEDGYTTRVHAFRGVGRRPLSPVHVRATRSAGDITLTWIRRTRIGGDSWDAVEVPLSEESERYEIDILDGTTVVRTIATTTPSATYSSAQQTADFGAPQLSLAVRVHQIGATWGRGSPVDAVV